MFSYSLRLGRDGKMRWSVGAFWKIASAVFAFIVGLGIVLILAEGSFDWTILGPVLIFVLLVVSAAYRDGWTFDNAAREAVCVFGFGPFVSKRVVPYSQVKGVSVTHFRKGIADGVTAVKPSWRHKEMIVFALDLESDIMDEQATLEIAAAKKNTTRIAAAASGLSAHTGFELTTDKPLMGRTL